VIAPWLVATGCLHGYVAQGGDPPRGSGSRTDDDASRADGGGPTDARDILDVTVGRADVAPTDARWDAAVDAPQDAIPPVPFCARFDADWQTNVNGPWQGLIVLDPGNPASFAEALTTDCRTHAIAGVIPDGGVPAYLDQLVGWTSQFFGCTGTYPSPLSFAGLLPKTPVNHVYTRGDLDLLAQLYVNAVTTEVALAVAMYDSGAPLNPAQVAQVQSTLAALEARMPGVAPSAAYSLDTCE
jgi:hypothetical protein